MGKKKQRKTYGVYGMMEYQALIPTLKNRIRVEFSGGSVSGYGVRPATYTTENPMIQYFIENSFQYKSGKIELLRTENMV